MSIADVPLWEWIWIACSLVSSVLHCFVLSTIIRAKLRKSNSLLKGPFFTIIGIQGIHELIEIATVNGFNRLRKYRIIKYTVEHDNDLVEWQWYWFIFMKNILYMGHLLIAANRLSAVLFKGFYTYDRVWTTRNILLMACCGYLLSIMLRVVIFNPNAQFTTFIFNGTDVFSFEQTDAQFTFENSIDICLSFGSALFCASCYATVFVASRKNGFNRLSSQIKSQELVLLKCGIITFLMLLPTTIRSALEMWSQITEQTDFLLFIQKWNMLPAEAMCVSQPWLLLLSCKALRRATFRRKAAISEFSNSQHHWAKNSTAPAE